MAASAARRDLELRIKVTAQKGDTAAMQDFSQQLARWQGQLASIGGSLAQMSPNRGRPTNAPGTGSMLAAGAGDVFGGGGFARMAAGAAAVTATAAAIGEALGKLDNNLLTTRQKILGVAESIPLVGSYVASTIDNTALALDRVQNRDRARRLDALRMTQPRDMGIASLREQGSVGIGSLEREINSARFSADTIAAVPLQSTIDLRDRQAGGLGGFAAAALQMKRDPRETAALDAIQQAKRGEYQADLEAGFAYDRLSGQEGVAERAVEQAAAARQRAEDSLAAGRGQRGSGERRPGQGVGMDGIVNRYGGRSGGFDTDTAGRGLEEAQRDAQVAIQKAMEEQNRLQRDATANKEKQLALARAEFEVSKAETNLVKTRLALAQEEKSRLQGAALQFGGMAENEQYALAAALKRFKEGGKEAVSKDQLALLQGSAVTGKFVGEALQVDASADPLFKGLLKQTNQRDLETVKAEVDKLAIKVAGQLHLDEKQAADVMKKAVESVNEDLVGIINRIVQVQIGKLKTDVELGQTSRGQ